MSARLRDGWLVVDYDGPELTVIELGTGSARPEQWRTAFLDYLDGKRVAKVRMPTTGSTSVWLRVRGTVTRVGKVTP